MGDLELKNQTFYGEFGTGDPYRAIIALLSNFFIMDSKFLYFVHFLRKFQSLVIDGDIITHGYWVQEKRVPGSEREQKMLLIFRVQNKGVNRNYVT